MFSVGKENTRCAVMELVFYLRATQGEREQRGVKGLLGFIFSILAIKVPKSPHRGGPPPLDGRGAEVLLKEGGRLGSHLN
jgi:hypothetical protein